LVIGCFNQQQLRVLVLDASDQNRLSVNQTVDRLSSFIKACRTGRMQHIKSGSEVSRHHDDTMVGG
jgi:hypothetical protein